MGRFFLAEKALLICWCKLKRKKATKAGRRRVQQKTMGTWVGDAESGRLLFFYTRRWFCHPLAFFSFFSHRALASSPPDCDGPENLRFGCRVHVAWADNISLDLSISNTHGTQQCLRLRVDSKRSVNDICNHFLDEPDPDLPIPIFPTHEHDYQNQYAVLLLQVRTQTHGR
jgi:hypothetical protein